MELSQFPQVLSFDGATFVSLGAGAEFELTGVGFTLEAWIRPDGAVGQAQWIVCNADLHESAVDTAAESMNRGLNLLLGEHYVPLFVAPTGKKIPGATPLLPNVWTHLAVAFDGVDGGYLNLFVNGRLEAREALVDLFPQERSLPIKDMLLGSPRAGEGFQGVMAEVRFWKRARSREEIQETLYARLSGSEPGLVGYWPLDGTLEEKTGRHVSELQADRQEGVWEPANVPIQPRSDMLATFDGKKAYIDIDVPESFALDLANAFTVEAWVRPTSTATAKQKDLASSASELFLAEHPVVGQHGWAAGWELRCGGNEAEFMVTFDTRHQYTKTDQVRAGSWNHLAGVFDGKSLLFFLNGVLQGSQPEKGAITLKSNEFNPDRVSIGCNPHWGKDPMRMFTGQIAEVRVWKSARTQAQIETSIAVRLNGTEEGLVACWRLDDGGEQIHDASRNGHHGAQHGVAWASTFFLSDPREELIQRLYAYYESLLRECENCAGQLDVKTSEGRELLAMRDELLARIDQLEKGRLKLEHRERERQALVADLERQLGERRESVEPETPVTLTNLIKNANDQITRAREELVAAGGTYRLGRVTMELKMLPTASGTAMIFPRPGGSGHSAGLSTVNLDFSPKTGTETPRDTTIEVPDLTGYTELMAQRKLRAAGLLMDVAFQAVTVEENKPRMIDRVVNQNPKPREQVRPNSYVRVFIGKIS